MADRADAEALEETILTEIVANSLDSRATAIRLDTDPAAATLTVTDDGSGMQRRELSRYHDIASSGKTRGQGIGFAGVGIKLGLLVSTEVLTETCRGAYLERHDTPLPEDLRGVALSTFGKVIKRGWDWLGLSPAGADRVTGLVEAPELAESLTLSKADFVRTGPRGARYLAYRKVLQEAVSAQLALWGDAAEMPLESRRRHTRPIERDLESVLVDLARTFPLLASLVEHRPGGQKRLPLGGEEVSVADPPTSGSSQGSSPELQAEAEKAGDPAPESVSPEAPEPEIAPGRTPPTAGRSRRGRRRTIWRCRWGWRWRLWRWTRRKPMGS